MSYAYSTPELQPLPHAPAKEVTVRRYQQAVYARLLHFTRRQDLIQPEFIAQAERLCPDLTGLNSYMIFMLVNTSAVTIYSKESTRGQQRDALIEGAALVSSPLILGKCRLLQRLVRSRVTADMETCGAGQGRASR